MECSGIDLTKVCRTCKSADPEMKSLYYRDSENGKENPRLDEMLMACASVQVDTEDDLPKLICRSCFEQLKNAYMFKEQCEKTDIFLRIYLQTIKDIKVEDEILDDLEFTPSEVVCDVKPSRLTNEIYNGDAADAITDNQQVWSEREGVVENADYIQMVVNNVIIYKCIVCSKEFYTLEGLKYHKRLHMDKEFKCKQCDRTYTRLNHLQRHQLSHGKRKTYVCNICNKSFTRYEHVKRHLTTHLKTRPFSCPICKRGFNRVQRLEKHVTICKGKRMYVCDICNSAFRREDSMLVHKREHEHKGAILPTLENLNNIQEYYTKIEDNDVATTFSGKEDFRVVRKNMRPGMGISAINNQVRKEEIPSIIDEYSNEQPPELMLQKVKIEKVLSLASSNDLGEKQAPGTDNGNDYESNDSVHHKYKPTKQSTPVVTRGRGRPRKYPVGYQSGGKAKGSKVPKRRRILQRSIQTAGREIDCLEIDPFECENKFQCKTCRKIFLSKSHLAEHIKYHKDSLKKFLCSECGQKFIRRDFLAIHMRRHRGEKPFKCKFCAYSFTRLADLTAHEKNHTGEKTHLCALCGKGFGRFSAYYLTLHMRRHTGEKPYGCSYCDASFVQGNDLKVHVRKHTGERFSCELCPKTFLTASLLTQHKRLVHGVNVINTIRQSEIVEELDPDDLPPATLLPAPSMITNSLASDPLQISQ